MLGHNAQCVNVSSRAVHTKAVRPKGENFASCSGSSGLGETVLNTHAVYKLPHEPSDTAQNQLPDEDPGVRQSRERTPANSLRVEGTEDNTR